MISTPSAETCGQIVLVTGAGTGMGALASMSLAEAGHTVYATMREPDGRNREKAEALRSRSEGLAGHLHVIELDILSEDSAAHAVNRIVEEQSRIDVVVHNAAQLYVGHTEDFTPEDFAKPRVGAVFRSAGDRRGPRPRRPSG